MKRSALAVLAAGLLAVAGANCLGAAPSLSMGPNGLVYTTDALGNRIPDYSYAGYGGGGVAIPMVPIKRTVSVVSGDNTANIQNAINAVAAMTPDANGFRGAVYLNAGTYTCSGSLSWSAGGVVLRGAGPGTVILATGAARTFLSARGSSSTSTTGSAVSITDSYVPCGGTTFSVTSTSGFAVGSTVIINRPTVQSWIDDIHMGTSQYLGTEGWTPNSGLKFERTITAINGLQVTIDIPLCNSIETTAYGLTGTMQRYTDNRIKYIGLENLTLAATFNDVPPAVTPGNVLNASAANFDNCEQSWMRNVKLTGYGNGLTFGGGAKWCSMLDCDYEFPCTDGNTAAQPAAFTVSGRQTLCARLTSSNGFHYHMLVTQAYNAGPDVFLDCKATTHDWLDAGPHQKWAAGMLFDRIVFVRTSGSSKCELDLNNRNDFGTGQGWSMGFSTAYNCQTTNISVQEPTYATKAPFYNWCIGGKGNKLTSGNSQDPNGEFQNFGTLVQPSSLYLEQLQERKGSSALQAIGYPRFSGTYKLLNQNSSLAVVVKGGLTADGTAIVQSAFVNTAADKWQFIDVGGGRYEIKNANSGKALAASSSGSGAAIVQTTYKGNGLDQWVVTDVAGNVTKIVNRASGMVLEVPGASTADNVELDQNGYTGAASQRFAIVAAP